MCREQTLPTHSAPLSFIFSVLASSKLVVLLFISNLYFFFFLTLQCDGQYIPLPSLQGIAVLNIPSYAGGTNFWGGTKEDDVSNGSK